MKKEGGTDYIAIPMICSNGMINAITWAADREGGFTDDEIDGLTDIAAALSVVGFVHSIRPSNRAQPDEYLMWAAGPASECSRII